MAQILRQSDRMKLTIGDVTFKLAPYSQDQKSEINSLTVMQSGEQIIDALGRTKLCLKYCVKEVKGIKLLNEKEYQLEKDENGNLTDECVEDMTGVFCNNELVSAATQLLHSIPVEVINPVTNKPFEYVAVTFEAGGSGVKK